MVYMGYPLILDPVAGNTSEHQMVERASGAMWSTEHMLRNTHKKLYCEAAVSFSIALLK